jgi:hypothetical protein
LEILEANSLFLQVIGRSSPEVLRAVRAENNPGRVQEG